MLKDNDLEGRYYIRQNYLRLAAYTSDVTSSECALSPQDGSTTHHSHQSLISHKTALYSEALPEDALVVGPGVCVRQCMCQGHCCHKGWRDARDGSLLTLLKLVFECWEDICKFSDEQGLVFTLKGPPRNCSIFDTVRYDTRKHREVKLGICAQGLLVGL